MVAVLFISSTWEGQADLWVWGHFGLQSKPGELGLNGETLSWENKKIFFVMFMCVVQQMISWEETA